MVRALVGGGVLAGAWASQQSGVIVGLVALAALSFLLGFWYRGSPDSQ